MNRLIGRRAAFAIAAAAGAALAAGQAVADVRGEVVLADGGPVPEGTLEVRIEDPAAPHPAARFAATTRISSDGTSRRLPFALPSPDGTPGSPEVVAVLERLDGWLVARGSAPLAADGPVRVTLYPVMY